MNFEREEKFNELLQTARKNCPAFKAATLKKIIAGVNPAFLNGLFGPRPCTSKLEYTGGSCDKQPCADDADDFFEVGKIYQAVDFTGATYAIKGAGGRRIGTAHFEEI